MSCDLVTVNVTEGGDNVSIAVSQAVITPDRLPNIEFVSATTISVTPGAILDSNGTRKITVSTPLTLDTTVAGIGGIDDGAPATSPTWYYPYVLSGDLMPTVAVLSTSPTLPTLPTGYTVYRKIGSIINYLASNILRFVRDRDTGFTYWDINDNFKIIVADGNANTLTVLPLSDFAPPTATWVSLSVLQKTLNRVAILYVGGDASRGNQFVQTSNGFNSVNIHRFPADDNQLGYQTFIWTGSVTIRVQGYWEGD